VTDRRLHRLGPPSLPGWVGPRQPPIAGRRSTGAVGAEGRAHRSLRCPGRQAHRLPESSTHPLATTILRAGTPAHGKARVASANESECRTGCHAHVRVCVPAAGWRKDCGTGCHAHVHVSVPVAGWWKNCGTGCHAHARVSVPVVGWWKNCGTRCHTHVRVERAKVADGAVTTRLRRRKRGTRRGPPPTAGCPPLKPETPPL
jgi:hypothetical protein